MNVFWRGEKQAAALIIMSAVGICTLPAGGDVTERQQKSAGDVEQTERCITL